MDISKLPRLSQTTTPAPPADEPVPKATTPGVAGFPVVPVTSPTNVLCVRCGTANAPGALFCNGCGGELGQSATLSFAPAPIAGPGIGAEVWLSAIIGIVLMLLKHSFAAWAVAALTGSAYHTNVNWTAGPNAGQEVAYWDLEGFTALEDAAVFLFGFALVLEAAVLAVVHSRVRSKRPLLLLAITITLVATALNLVVAGKLVGAGVTPLLSLLALGFGGYIAAYEWRLYRYFQPTSRRT